REAEGDTEGLEGDGDVAVLIAAGRHGEFAAGQERGDLARDRGQGRLGERADGARLFEGAERHAQVIRRVAERAGGGVVAQRLVGHAERAVTDELGRDRAG